MSIDDQDAGAADDTEHEEDDEETLELVSLDEVIELMENVQVESLEDITME